MCGFNTVNFTGTRFHFWRGGELGYATVYLFSPIYYIHYSRLTDRWYVTVALFYWHFKNYELTTRLIPRKFQTKSFCIYRRFSVCFTENCLYLREPTRWNPFPNSYLVNTGNFEPIICSLMINNVQVVNIMTVNRFVASIDHVEKVDLPLNVHPMACCMSLSLNCKIESKKKNNKQINTIIKAHSYFIRTNLF